jgi:hypothetical protein
MPERAINTKSATGCMLVLIPAALTMSALFVAWPVILGVTLAIAGGNIWQSYEWTKTARSIDPVFQQLIIQNRGEISALDLSLRANVSGKVSDRYLVAKASEFGTGRRQHPDRGQVYYFVTVSTLGQIFDDSEIETPAIMPATTPVATFPQTVATEYAPVMLTIEDRLENRPAVNIAPMAMSFVLDAPVVESDRAIEPSIEVSSSDSDSLAPDVPVSSPDSTELMNQESGRATAPDRSEHQSIVSIIAAEQSAETRDDATPIETALSPPIVAVDDPAPPTSPLVIIIQSELAKRLDVHSSTIYKRRSEPNFTDWTRNRDPEGIAWGYAEATKEYYRVDT